jgi:hypothetical protein
MSNQVYENQTTRYIDTELNLIKSKIPQPAQSITLNMTGPFTSLSLPFKYVINNTNVILFFDATTGLSTNGASTSIVSSNTVPSTIKPSIIQNIPCPIIIASSTTEVGMISINTSGNISFVRANNTAWPNAQNVGINRCQITYSLI